jgi:hypothetical protein
MGTRAIPRTPYTARRTCREKSDSAPSRRSASEEAAHKAVGKGYFFRLLVLAVRRSPFRRGDRRFVCAPAALVAVLRGRAARESFFLARRRRLRGPAADSPSFAAWRTLAAMLSGMAERLSANSWVTLVSVPAACPSVRATVFKSGFCVTARFLAAIYSPRKSFVGYDLRLKSVFHAL